MGSQTSDQSDAGAPAEEMGRLEGTASGTARKPTARPDCHLSFRVLLPCSHSFATPEGTQETPRLLHFRWLQKQ